ncbi:DUF7594 domain-containing protein [Autumnicola musiva]|uniref:DNRLRE domain-containing protein n=1 Tax=Autumnicola musiva TaxID=3075589 RepID=A0ABU3D852_9FLAO|nr:DNRLRE domain-containing protein [Zunongwangia sp. F117]MDT0677193.1 DNRLRE domain-containing protein [Zunongwangia sp. F117]
MKKNNKIRHFSHLIMAICCLSFLSSCEIQESFEYTKSNPEDISELTAWEFIQNHDSLAMYEEAIRLTGLESFYQEDSSRTFIAPNNSAFENYLSDNGYASLEEIPRPILRNSIKYSIVNGKVSFNDPDLFEANNPIAYETGNGQVMYLSHDSNFRGLINEGTSNQWTITTSNLEVENGAVHVTSSIVYFSALQVDTGVPDYVAEKDTIYPLHDAFVNGGNLSGNNYGSDQLLKVKNVTGEGPYDRKAYLMFDLSEFDKEGVITDLKLELAVRFTHGKGLDFYVHSVSDTLWNEMGLTWDNAPAAGPEPIASIVTSKMSTFEFDLTDYYLDLEGLGKASFMLDQTAGGDETDEFASKENTTLPAPMLIATLASGESNLVFETNSGFTVNEGDVFALDNSILEISGAPVADIIYTVEEVPTNGWLLTGATILEEGASFTQNDIDVMNILYINNGGGSDNFVLSARDRAGSRVEPFDVSITIN